MTHDQAYDWVQGTARDRARGRAQSVGAGMTPSQRAFLEVTVALAAWRAAKDAEAQVAHWLTEGRATREELVEYRARTRAAHALHQRAQRLYHRACSVSSVSGSVSSSVAGSAG